jgi:hypothetical protein
MYRDKKVVDSLAFSCAFAPAGAALRRAVALCSSLLAPVFTNRCDGALRAAGPDHRHHQRMFGLP